MSIEERIERGEFELSRRLAPQRLETSFLQQPFRLEEEHDVELMYAAHQDEWSFRLVSATGQVVLSTRTRSEVVAADLRAIFAFVARATGGEG